MADSHEHIDPRIAEYVVVPDGETLADTLGFVIDREDDGTWTISCDVQNVHLQPLGLVHGGVYASMAETIASVGTVAAVFPDGNIAVGQSNLTHFVRPVTSGRVIGRARPIHRGRTSWIWDVDMTNEEGKLAARSTVTMAVRPGPT